MKQFKKVLKSFQPSAHLQIFTFSHFHIYNSAIGNTKLSNCTKGFSGKLNWHYFRMAKKTKTIYL